MRLPHLARAALGAALLLVPSAAALAQSASPVCARQATDRLQSLGVDPASVSATQSAPVQNSTNGGVSQYQVWFNSNACQGGYVVVVRSDCVPIGVEGARGQCTLSARR